MSDDHTCARYIEVVKQMTLEEKAGLLSGKNNWQTKSIGRLGIPSLFCADGPHGLRVQLGAADHLGLNPSANATCFPPAATIANSWNPELGERIGRLLGDEAMALGVSVLLGPGLNIKRNPLCGRNFEYFSEDPYLSGKMAAGYVRGIQSNGVAACPKHFAANSQETLRMANDSVVDERTLRELYLTGFEIVVKESSPKALMTSYNMVNGVYANEHPHLLGDILSDDWKFDGFVISDWGGSNDHVDGVIAGSHLEMPASGKSTDIELLDAVRSGRLDEALLDRRVEEFLRVAFMMNPVSEPRPNGFDVDSHHEAARQAAQESIVLLKNEDALLPLHKDAKLALIGDFVQTPRYQGAGSSLVNITRLENTLEMAEQQGLQLVGHAPGFRRSGAPDPALREAACALAGQAEVVLLYLGLDELKETEGLDRSDMRLADNQIELLQAIQKVNPNIVVVLSCGSAVEMPWLMYCKAVVHGYLSGQAGAGAVLDVLTGRVNPSGKLAESYPVSYQDVPSHAFYPGKQYSSEYREGLYVGYRYFEKMNIPVCFPFGFGLSYTQFAYSNLVANEGKVVFTITNTGEMAGAEIAQLYVGKKDSVIFRPFKELKGFTKVLLQPGESKEVTITLDDKAFRYFNTQTNRFEVESGSYELYIGSSSADIRLTTSISVEGTVSEHTGTAALLPHYHSGDVSNVPDAEFEALLGRKIPPSDWNPTKLLGRNDTFTQLYYAKSPLARLVFKILHRIKRKAEAKGKPDLNILFIYNMPFRGLAKFGMFDMPMVDALLFLLNGHFFRGVGRLVGAWRRRRKREKQFGGIQ